MFFRVQNMKSENDDKVKEKKKREDILLINYIKLKNNITLQYFLKMVIFVVFLKILYKQLNKRLFI